MLLTRIFLMSLTLAAVNCRPNFPYNQSVPYTNLQSDPDNFNPLDFSELTLGVDLNRNFGYKWELYLNEEDNIPKEETYRGPSAFSEPESRAIGDFLQQYAKSIVLFVDLHTYGEYILIPLGYTTEPAPNADFLMSVAQAGSAAVLSQTNQFYLVGTPPQLLYAVSGSSLDYCYSVGVKACIAIELTGDGFEIEPSNIIPHGQEALAAVQAMAVKADEG